MPISLFEATLPPFIQSLKTLSTLLNKGLTHTSGAEETLLASRLISDMHPLPYQIQRVSDTAKGVVQRLTSGRIAASWDDNEKTFTEMQERIQKTITFLEKVTEKDFAEAEAVEVELWGKKMGAKEYVTGFAVPNFYFHYTVAYGLLRKEGVPIGKRDYISLIQ